MCCGPAEPAQVVCFACRTVGRRLGLPLAPVMPVALCVLPGPLYTVLLGYKESSVREARSRFAPMVGALFASHLRAHAPCVAAVAGGSIDVVVPVPSTRRPSGSPLGAVVGLADAACAPFPGARWAPELLVPGAAPARHM
ncbi:MAG TPA: hypothetical protein VHD39_03230, partial [Acidimicrobiales bacterium]|nr:hypothetical protein [Acidimicrobiales bacterium]